MSDRSQLRSKDEGSEGQGTSHEFSAPLGATQSGRLVFMDGAAGVAIHADPVLSDLYRARFEQHVPRIQVHEGVVSVRYRRRLFFDWPIAAGEPTAEIALNGSIPWELEMRGGIAKLNADLRGLQLRAFDLGSVSQSILVLPQPVGATFIYISGAASDVAIHRPRGVSVRVQISSGISHLTLDEQHFGAVANGLRWQTPDYNPEANRYEISIAGGASQVTVGAR